MRRLLLLFVIACVCGSVASAAEGPDWAKRTFAASPAEVFRAARLAVSHQRHEIKNADEVARLLTFHVGTTAWSWGYNMTLRVEPASADQSRVTVDIERSGGKAVSWGSGSKEVRKIFEGIAAELGLPSPAQSQPQPTSSAH